MPCTDLRRIAVCTGLRIERQAARLPGALGKTVYPCPAAAAGYHVLSVDTASSLPSGTCALDSSLSYGSPPMFQRCTLSPAGTTLLSVYVDKTCAGGLALRSLVGWRVRASCGP